MRARCSSLSSRNRASHESAGEGSGVVGRGRGSAAQAPAASIAPRSAAERRRLSRGVTEGLPPGGDPQCLELLAEPRHQAGGGVPALYTPVLTPPALVEAEDVL